MKVHDDLKAEKGFECDSLTHQKKKKKNARLIDASSVWDNFQRAFCLLFWPEETESKLTLMITRSVQVDFVVVAILLLKSDIYPLCQLFLCNLEVAVTHNCVILTAMVQFCKQVSCMSSFMIFIIAHL